MTQTYHQMTFECARNIAEPLAGFLADSCALSVSLIDAADDPIYEPALNETPLWAQVKVIALFAQEAEAHDTLALLSQLLEYTPTCQIELIEERDWVSETQAQFKPQCFGEKLWVYPEWHAIKTSQKPMLKLAPGLAFGTGTHPTTQMCLEALAQSVDKNIQLVDFGCGSGILGLAALALGASYVYCIDIDPQALEATQRNALINEFDEEALFIGLPDTLPMIKTDIIVANILAKPLIELQSLFENLLKPNGTIILSGLLESQVEFLVQAYKPWVELTLFRQQQEWICLIGCNQAKMVGQTS